MYRQPYHLVEFSAWPLLGSLAILSMPVGLIAYIRMNSPYLLILGLISTAVIATVWWRDVVRESSMQGFHSSQVVYGIKVGVTLFIVSEVCFFFAFFWAYFHSSLTPSYQVGCVWPPIGITTLGTFQVPLLNTTVLLLSGVSITWCHHAIEEKARSEALAGLLVTLLLGVYFLFLQYNEYMETGFSMADSVYGSSFFLATGFHGCHVLVGATFLAVCLLRLWKFHFTMNHHVGFLAAAWYWHFVDVVWLFLYISIYWWGS
uniref:Cytochrome c oxidase subunit 3 n=1 Tax=Pyramidella dolabrata TaxID=252582 RepID=B3DFG7_9GAST|nr:cytochrome c oxidase subunit III [Pyramidella dolabrata]ACE62854.1 cytochrome c oxidase subunit III [Pyramidella dolabrata]